MAIKYDNDFDAQGFVDNFRAENPSLLPKEKKANKDNTPADGPIINSNVIVECSTTKSKSKISKSETDAYKEVLIDDLSYLCPPVGCSNVRILPEYVKKIRRLIDVCDVRRANLTTFINNLLRQHFEDNKEVVSKLLKEYAQNLE